MRIFKKTLISICIVMITLLSLLPNTSDAAQLTDGQRQALVKVASQIIIQGNKTGMLKYSQDHRQSGFAWSEVRNHSKQSTVSTWGLTKTDQDRVLEALKKDVLKRYPRDEKIQAQFGGMTTLAKKEYKCRTLGADIYGSIAFDCSSFCSAVYSMTLGTTFLWTTYNFKNQSSSVFNLSTNLSSVKPGDCLLATNEDGKPYHIAIYLGDYQNDGVEWIAQARGISSAGTEDKKIKVSSVLADFLIKHPTYIFGHPNYNPKNGLPVVELPEDCIRASNQQVAITKYVPSEFTHVCSYTGEVKPGKVIDVTGGQTVEDVNNAELVIDLKGGPTVEDVNNSGIVIGSGTASTAYWPDNYKLEDQALENSEGYFHKGTPAYGGYTTIISPLTWLLEKAPDFLDWLAGFITTILKMQVIGWTAIVENLVSNGLAFGTEDIDAITDESTGSLINDTIKVPVETTNKVTVEDIVFNNVPLLDINFFDFSHAAGQELSQNSIIYKIRHLLSQWYYTLRVLVIIVMLVILLYNTVRAIFTTAVSEKSEAKKKALDWLIGFIIVFTIHYIMIGIIWMNNQFVDILKPITVTQTQPSTEDGSNTTTNTNGSITQNNEESLYEQIRIQAYDIRAITGWTGTFMYVTMVIYLFMFVVLYLKRLFILAILTVISPFVGALYAFNKKTYTINTWLKEYVYNVLIQLIHAIVYTVLVAVALSVAKTSTILGGILALIMLGFVFTAEKLVKKILGYDSESLGGLSDSFAGQMALYLSAKAGVTWLGGKVGSATQMGEHLLEGKRLNRRERLEKAERESESRDNYATREAGYRTMTAITGKALKDLYKNMTDGKPLKGDYINRLSEYAKNAKQDYNNIYNQYLKQAEIGAYAGSVELQDIMNKRKKEARQARKEFRRNRYKGLANSIIATAGFTVGIPMLFLDRGKGLAMTAFGANSFKNTFSRKKIAGKRTAKTKFKGKKLLFFFCSPILAPAYANAMNNAIAEKQMIETTYGKVIQELEDIRKTEAEISYKMRQMYGEEFSPISNSQDIQNKLDNLNKSVLEAEKRDFKKALDGTVVKVSKKDMKRILFEYMEENKISRLTMKDYDNIRNRINWDLRRKGKSVSVSDSFTKNIEEQVRKQSGIDKQVEKKTKDENGKDKTELKARVEVKDIEKICRDIAKEHEKEVDNSTIKTIVTELKKDKAFRAVMETQNTEQMIEKIKDKLDEKIQDAKLAETLSQALETKMSQQIEEKTKQQEKQVEEIISSLKASEAADLLTKAVNSEGGLTVELKNSRYDDLMKDVKKLDELNESYYNLTGERVYKDVGKLVQNFRNNLLSNRGKD